MLIRICLLLISFGFAAISIAQADDDPRFHVSITFEQGTSPSITEQVNQALPILWQRILTHEASSSALQEMKPMSLLLSVRPQSHGSDVIFNPPRVWSYLEAQHIPHIRTIPTFHLQLELHNAFGNSMQESEARLLQYAKAQGKTLGIVFADNAPLLAIHIQWLDDVQAQLSVRGQSRLQEFSETRALDMGDPFLYLQNWVKDTLIRARDAYAWQKEVQATPEAAIDHAARTDLQFTLVIEQDASLSEQIALEHALKGDPRVKQLVPTYLNHHSRQYVITLKQPDDSWIPNWFEQHGMRATPNAQGWRIQ
jgi:hypothetical protein